MMKNNIRVCTAVLAGLLLSACVAPQIKYIDRPYETKIMVPVPVPEPPIIKKPFLPILLLKPENIKDPDLIAKYYVKSIHLLEVQIEKLQCVLDGYRTETEKQCTALED